jgi:hypothetical protein
MTAHSLQELLKSGDSMARLAAHAQRLLQFQQVLEATLPETLRPHARVANFRLGTIFIHATNSAVAAKIRQFGPTLARKLSTQSMQITEIQVKVQALNSLRPQPPHVRPALPGAQKKQGLASLEESLPPDSALKSALQQLLRTVKE